MQTILACFDHRRSGEARSIEVGGQRDDKDGLQCSGLFARTIGSQIRPPDLTALQLRSRD
jgi:hypothetical protein